MAVRDTEDMSERRYLPPGWLPDERDAGVAERLDAMRSATVERVLKRAIELQSDDTHGPDTYDRAMLSQIADELGIDPAYVERALSEELSAVPPELPPSVWHRFFAPRIMVERASLEADHHEAQSTVRTWMTRHEGLRPQRRIASGMVWEPDRSPVSAIRRGLKLSQGTGALRTVRSVTHHIEPVGDHRHVVTVEADTGIVTTVAASVGLSLAGAGGLTGTILGLAGVLPLWGGLLIAGGAVALGLGVSLTIAKTWASSLRRGLHRAIAGITNPDLVEAPESVPSMIMRLRDEWRRAKSGR